MGLQNHIETALLVPACGVTVSRFMEISNEISFDLDTADTERVAHAIAILDGVLTGQSVTIERFSTLDITTILIENPAISVSAITGEALIQEQQKFLDGVNEFTEINTHELVNQDPLQTVWNFIGEDELHKERRQDQVEIDGLRSC